jgi:hypothetical protein
MFPPIPCGATGAAVALGYAAGMDLSAEPTCARCGRRMEARAAWTRRGAAPKYCSEACRAARLDATDAALESALRALAAARTGGATFCPSEAARAVDPVGWEGRMEQTRQAARRLIARGELEMLQRGAVVDPSTARGPVRLRAAAPAVEVAQVPRGRRGRHADRDAAGSSGDPAAGGPGARRRRG